QPFGTVDRFVAHLVSRLLQLRDRQQEGFRLVVQRQLGRPRVTIARQEGLAGARAKGRQQFIGRRGGRRARGRLRLPRPRRRRRRRLRHVRNGDVAPRDRGGVIEGTQHPREVLVDGGGLAPLVGG